MIFHLPMPPSTNHLFSNARDFVSGKQKRVRSNHYKSWADNAGREMIAQRVPRRCLEGDIALSLKIGPRDRRSDISNRIKAVEDLCVSMGIIKDDRQVIRVSAEWGDVKGCRVEIETVEKGVE